MTSAPPRTMHAVRLNGHGGLEQLEHRTDVTAPQPGPGEVLPRVAAAGVNNTDINTRIGWYSKSASQDTGTGGASGFDSVDDTDASWSGNRSSSPAFKVPIAAATSLR